MALKSLAVLATAKLLSDILRVLHHDRSAVGSRADRESLLSTSKNIVVQACYNNFRRSREFCVLCCEFDVAIGTCCVGFIKDRMVNSFYSIAIAGK